MEDNKKEESVLNEPRKAPERQYGVRCEAYKTKLSRKEIDQRIVKAHKYRAKRVKEISERPLHIDDSWS